VFKPQPFNYGGFGNAQSTTQGFSSSSTTSWGFGNAQSTTQGFASSSSPFGGGSFGNSQPPTQGFASSSSPFGGSSGGPQSSAKPLQWTDYSQRPPGYTPRLDTNGMFDMSQLSAGLPFGGFQYTVNIGLTGAVWQPISPADMRGVGQHFEPSGADKQLSAAYRSYNLSKGHTQPSQKATVESEGRKVRSLHHQTKGKEKLVLHMHNLADTKEKAGTGAQVTETGGEFAAAAFMGQKHPDYQMKFSFQKGTGIDQIWVRRDGEGNITEYLIVEAKGFGSSGEASFNDTATKGMQMSQRWVVQSLLVWSTSGTNWELNRMAAKMLECIKHAKGVLVWGIGVTEQQDRSTVKVRYCGTYNFHLPTFASTVIAAWQSP
jgi:hypothetical protein